MHFNLIRLENARKRLFPDLEASFLHAGYEYDFNTKAGTWTAWFSLLGEGHGARTVTPTYTDSLSGDRSVGGGSGPQPEAPGTIWCVLAVRPRAAAASWMHVAGNCPAGLGRCLGVRIQPGSQPFVCPPHHPPSGHS